MAAFLPPCRNLQTLLRYTVILISHRGPQKLVRATSHTHILRLFHPMKDAGYNPHHDLDLISEETRISYALEDYSRKNNISDEDTGDGDATIARMSYLGPKMRFHSRAPWEEDALQEEDEDFLVNLPFPSKNTIKNIASGFSSPRPSFASSVNRPSEDSSNSQLSTRRSFETVNSQSSLSNPRGGL